MLRGVRTMGSDVVGCRLDGGTSLLDVAKGAVDAARAAGAEWADARAGTDESESLTVRNQEMEGIDRSTSTGIGIRVLVGGRWGFAATSRLDEAEIERTARLAVEMAKAAHRLPGDPVSLTPVEPVRTSWRTLVEEDPFTVPLEEKVALLMEASRQMQQVPGLSFAEAGLDFFRRSTWFASSDGAAIEQVVTNSGGGIEATAVGGGDMQRRSYPNRSGATSRRPATSTSARWG
jgi:TldD protein